MTDNISIKAAKLAKYGEHFDSGHWPTSAEQCFLTHPGRVLVGKHERTEQKARKEAVSINFF